MKIKFFLLVILIFGHASPVVYVKRDIYKKFKIANEKFIAQHPIVKIVAEGADAVIPSKYMIPLFALPQRSFSENNKTFLILTTFLTELAARKYSKQPKAFQNATGATVRAVFLEWAYGEITKSLQAQAEKSGISAPSVLHKYAIARNISTALVKRTMLFGMGKCLDAAGSLAAQSVGLK